MAQATLRLFFGAASSAAAVESSSFFMEDFLPGRDLGLGLTLAARRVVTVDVLLDDRTFLGSVERVLNSVLVSALRFDRPRTLPVRLAASWSTSIGCSWVTEGWRSSRSASLMLRVRLCWTEGLRGAEAEDWGLTEGEEASLDRMLLQFFRRQETSLSSCGVESSLHLARLISV